MKRERLTPERIRRFVCPPETRQAFLWDSVMPRLALRVTVAGSKAFIFESKLNRKTVRITIGSPDAWNLEDARAEAGRLQTQIDQGIDPRQEKAERVAEAEAQRVAAHRAAAPALEAWNAYLLVRSPKWSNAHRADRENVSKEGGAPRTRGRRPGGATPHSPASCAPC